MNKELPKNIEAEKCLIGSMFWSNESLQKGCEEVEKEVFYLDSIERMADERFGIDIIVRVEGDGIMILYEEECEEKIRPIKDRIRKEIHIPEKCINFKKVAAFKRNRNGKRCKGESYGNNTG